MPGTDDSPSAADRALLRADRAWGPAVGGDPWRRLAPAWRDRLATARAGAGGREAPGSALEGLRRDHEASRRPDPARVHPSWFVRALRAESPAVRLAVSRHGPEAIRHALRAGTGGEADETAPAREPDPEALGWALALWAERLVGDAPDRPDDPPVVVAMTRLRPRDLARLVKVAGQAKHAFAIEGTGPAAVDEAAARMSPPDRVRVAYFRRLIGAADPRLVPAARADLGAIGDDRRRAHSRLGLLTFGRLLGDVKPYRARWAIQHLPYPVVKLMRGKGRPPLPSRPLVAWESWIIEAAWARLLSEGWLVGRRGAPP